MKSKNLIYIVCAVGVVCVAYLGMRIFRNPAPVRKPQTQQVSLPQTESAKPAELAVPADPIVAQESAPKAAKLEVVASPAVVAAEPPVATAAVIAPPVNTAPSENIEALKLSIVNKTIEIETLKNTIEAKDRELVSARNWSNTRNEVIAQLRMEIKTLKEQIEKSASGSAANTEALEGVKARTFTFLP